jgi:hypothetical protein
MPLYDPGLARSLLDADDGPVTSLREACPTVPGDYRAEGQRAIYLARHGLHIRNRNPDLVGQSNRRVGNNALVKKDWH